MMNNKFSELLKSRKFWAAVVGLVITAAKGMDPNFPIEESQINDIVFLLVAYIVGTGLDSRVASS